MTQEPGQAFTGAFDAATTKILPSAQVTRLHLLRHGEVRGLTQRIVRGQMDEPLSPRGEIESRELAQWFARHAPRPDVVLTSDLVRCSVLGADVARRAGRELVVDARLREQSMGAWEGRTWADITSVEPSAVTAYWDNYYESRPTGGESFADLEARVVAWWEVASRAYAGHTIVVATHIGVIRALACHLLGLRGDQALRFAPATGSHTSFLIGEAGAVLAQCGERPWSFGEGAVVANSSTMSARKPRIALSGSAGTGKTTLGRRLAAELGVPFIDEIMRRRIEAGFDIHGMSHSDWRALMREQWSEQRALEDAALDGFVVDRSSLDYAAFFLHYDLHLDGDAQGWMAQMSAESARYDAVLLFPWGALPLVNDGVRSTNPFTQLRFQTILEGTIERFARTRVIRVPETNELEQRLSFIMAGMESAPA
ncbi:MAG: histidine phosphatase family protein [Planctomycetes bacterium]|nr:histidine phosphatase family protein [Planctomycetota bacterium]